MLITYYYFNNELLLLVITVVMDPLLPIISRSIIGNIGFYYYLLLTSLTCRCYLPKQHSLLRTIFRSTIQFHWSLGKDKAQERIHMFLFESCAKQQICINDLSKGD